MVMRVLRKRRGQLAAVLATVLIVAACSSGSPGPSTPGVSGVPSTGSLTPGTGATAASGTSQAVSLILNFTPNIADTGFALAVKAGYYAAEGLDVTITPGRGSSTSAKLVASGANTFGLVSASAVVPGVRSGEKIKMLADILPAGSAGIAYLCDRQITTPAALKGTKIADPAGGTGLILLPTILKNAGLAASDVTIVNVDPNAKISAVMSGQVDAMSVTVYDRSLQIAAQQVGKTACTTAFASWGTYSMDLGIIASDATIGSHPEQVQAFVRASLKGWDAAVADPSAATDALLAVFPDLGISKAELLLEWQLWAPLMHTSNTAGKPTGWMAPADWDSLLGYLTDSGVLKTQAPAASYYTNQFVPDR